MKILKPAGIAASGHDGSSFREILDIWKERNYCEIIDNVDVYSDRNVGVPDSWKEARPWVESVGNILLYDNPILDRVPGLIP